MKTTSRPSEPQEETSKYWPPRRTTYVLLIGLTAATGAMVNTTVATGIGTFTGVVGVVDMVLSHRGRRT